MGATVDDLLADVSICICVGSGGVGKTTTSAAIAAGMAARGLKVAVLTIDPAKRLADSLGLTDLGNDERRVDRAAFERAGANPGDGELWATMLDAKATFDDVVARHAPDEEARRRILDNRIYRGISGALAGSQEYMAMERLYEINERGGYDLLVLDTPPSRNAVDFLDAPRRLVRFIDGRAIRIFLRPTGLGSRVAGRGVSAAFSVLRRLTGLDLIADLSEFFGAMSGMIGGFRARSERVEALLADQRTCFLIVCGPADEPVEEAEHLRDKLASAGLPLGGVVVNRTHRRVAGDAAQIQSDGLEQDLTELLGDSDLAARVHRSRNDEAALIDRDAGNVTRLAKAMGATPLIQVPEMSDEVHDLAGLLALGPHLFRTN